MENFIGEINNKQKEDIKNCTNKQELTVRKWHTRHHSPAGGSYCLSDLMIDEDIKIMSKQNL